MVNYSYYKSDDPVVSESLKRLRLNPEISSVLTQKEEQHKHMMSVAESRGFESYLSMAPSGFQYRDICRLIEV